MSDEKKLTEATPFVGKKLENFIQKYVELPLQKNAKIELDNILQEFLVKIYK